MGKNFGSVAAQLKTIADGLPSQVPPAEAAARTVPPVSARAEEPAAAPAVRRQPARQATPPADALVKFTMQLRKAQRRQLLQLAAEQDMTARAFILAALRDKGLSVSADDLADARRARA